MPQTYKELFLKSVINEIKNIKKFASLYQIRRLSMMKLSPGWADKCIYGLMTGDCYSYAAKKLIYKCVGKYCVTDMYKTELEIYKANPVNDPTKKVDDRECATALEWYMYQLPENNALIIDFIKGKTTKLLLPPID